MAKSRNVITPREWVNERMAAVGSYTARVIAAVGCVQYTFADLPDLATTWCRFNLDMDLPADPTPADVDHLMERAAWYRGRHAAAADALRARVIDQYRACDDYLPRELTDAQILAQVQRGTIILSVAAAGESHLAAELFVAFDGDHGPLFEWDESIPGWSQIG